MTFAERCMQIKSTRYVNEVTDWEDECAKLQVQLAETDQVYVQKMTGESEKVSARDRPSVYPPP